MQISCEWIQMNTYSRTQNISLAWMVCMKKKYDYGKYIFGWVDTYVKLKDLHSWDRWQWATQAAKL